MTVSLDARTPSASVHALSGSTPPGAARPMQPFGIATASAGIPDAATSCAASRAVAPLLDAEVISLANRVMALNRRERVLWTRLAATEDAVDRALPPRPADAMDMLAFERLEAATGARLGLPSLVKLAQRASHRLDRWALRLAHLTPGTRAGLKAKADAAHACAAGQAMGLIGWRQGLATSISADALRIIGAEADARAEEDRQADGELLALGRAWEASCIRHKRASAAEEALFDTRTVVAPPQALFARPGDVSAICLCPVRHGVGNPLELPWYGFSGTIETLRRMEQGSTVNARRDEIIDAYDHWCADVAAENERSGLAAAEAEMMAAVAENTALRARICMMPSRTQRGVDLKLRVVLWLHHDLDGLVEDMAPESVEAPEFSATLALSVALDLARMGRGVAPVAETAQIASAA